MSSDPVLVARRPGRPRDESIDLAILAAVVDELTARGYTGMSMEAIAARAGVAKTTVYRRWRDRQEMILAAIRTMDQPADDPPPGPARTELLYLLERMRKMWANPRYGALMSSVAGDGSRFPQEYRHIRDLLIAPHLARMNAAIERCVHEGVIREGLDLVWARELLTSPVLAAVLTHRNLLTRAQVEFTLDTVLAGLRPGCS